jgi:hypothetical protein
VRGASGLVRLKLHLAHPPLSAPFGAPVVFSLVTADGAHTGLAARCLAKHGGLTCR